MNFVVENDEKKRKSIETKQSLNDSKKLKSTENNNKIVRKCFNNFYWIYSKKNFFFSNNNLNNKLKFLFFWKFFFFRKTLFPFKKENKNDPPKLSDSKSSESKSSRFWALAQSVYSFRSTENKEGDLKIYV